MKSEQTFNINIISDIKCEFLTHWFWFLTENGHLWFCHFCNICRTWPFLYTDNILLNLIQFRIELQQYIIKIMNVKKIEELL